MMAIVPHVICGSGLRKFQADGFFWDRVNVHCLSFCIVHTVFNRIILPGRLAQCQNYVSHSGGEDLKPQPTKKCDVYLFLRIVIRISSFTSDIARF